MTTAAATSVKDAPKTEEPENKNTAAAPDANAQKVETQVETLSPAEQALADANAAVEAWQAAPSDELKQKAQEAVTKAKETAAAERKTAKEEKEKKPNVKVVPEKYDIKLPEGSKLDAKHLEGIASFAKERGLSNEDAQALVERDKTLMAQFEAGQQVTLKETTDKWLVDAKADKEIGGENFVKNAELSKRVLDRFGSQALKDELSKTGLGNFPELVRVFVRIGKTMSEDQLVLPGTQTKTKTPVETKFYGESKN